MLLASTPAGKPALLFHTVLLSSFCSHLLGSTFAVGASFIVRFSTSPGPSLCLMSRGHTSFIFGSLCVSLPEPGSIFGNGKCSEDFEWMGSHANDVAITWPAILVMISKPSPTLDMYPGPGLVTDLQHSLSYIILSPPTSFSPFVGDLK